MTEATTTNGHCVSALPDDTTMSPVDSSSDYCRSFLGPYTKEPVIVTGTFAKTERKIGVNRHYVNALFMNVEIELPDRARHWVDHSTVGNVETIQHIARGSRIRCRCKVYRYANKHLPEEQRYGVQFPTLIEVISDPPMPEVVIAEPTSAPAPAIDILAALTGLVGRVREAGGQKSVRDLLAAIELAGGWEAVERVRLLVGQLGGVDRLGQFLDMLKGD